MEKITSAAAYLIAVTMAFIGALTPQEIAFYIGVWVAIGTFFVNWYYRRKSYQLLKKLDIRQEIFDELNR